MWVHGFPVSQLRFYQERAGALGLTTRQIADVVVKKVRGEVATRYSFRDRKIDVLVREQASDRGSVDDIRHLIVNPGSSRPVTLDAVADEIGSAHVRTPVTNAHLVCRLLLEKKKAK